MQSSKHAPPAGSVPEPRGRPSEAPSIAVGPEAPDLRRALDAERKARNAAEMRTGAVVAERDALIAERDKQRAEMDKLASAKAETTAEMEAALAERDRLRDEVDSLRAERDSLTPRSSRISLSNILGREPLPSRPEMASRPSLPEIAPRPSLPSRPSLITAPATLPPPPEVALKKRVAGVFLLLGGLIGLGVVFAMSPQALEVAPGAIELRDQGASQALAATRTLRFGGRRPSPAAVWSSEDPRVARVDDAGNVVAAGTGRTRVEARDGSLRATAEVTVRLPARVVLAPAALTLTPDQAEAALAASILDGEGAPWVKDSATITWTSSVPGVVEVAGGKVHRVGPGKAVVEARFGEIRASIEVTSLDRREGLERACEGGTQDACVALARLVEQGEGSAPDPAAALAILQKACDAGSARACAEIGARREAQPAPDYARVSALYQKACEAGDSFGCTRLGRMYDTGIGIVGDAARALQLYRSACDAKLPEACARLAALYELGHGTARDGPTAAGLYRTACDGGYFPACASLANMLYNGSGTFPKDVPAGVSAYDRACDAGYEPACTVLALEYKGGGHGVAEDKDKSLAYFAKACAAGNKAACAVAPRR